MTPNELDWLRLCDEHGRVVSAYGRAQRRASRLIAAQARRIEALEAQVMQLRAAAIVRQTALVWAREDTDALHAAIPGLPKRRALAGHVRTLETRIRALIRAQTARPAVAAPAAARAPASAEKVVLWVSRADVQPDLQSAFTQRAAASAGLRLVQTSGENAARLDSDLADADLVICQVGCVSHGDWWRMKNYCTRTGKPCVLVDEPDALRRVIAARVPVAAGVDTKDEES
ncbi:DUF2325 domain-containing protein [Paraburkholderia acidisoli]|uniref:DUF2325 domain-containing protein n=1 Tax=Paraburkholderia acidisoli TaxID=2571748 RepID=A0A7Z2GN93_9BURK|nr:DUF2325 domain-containing protein [Paraburkholderia acidisoli]QGZ64920.1 DUF2325 domain-containing protein [Paraburkholderia acidisoli]